MIKFKNIGKDLAQKDVTFIMKFIRMVKNLMYYGNDFVLEQY